MADQFHSTDSSVREKLIEHLLIGELLKHLWCRGYRNVEVLHAEVDNTGYDVVFEFGGIMRHVQLKASYSGAKTSRVSISLDLAKKPSGCVVWVWFDPETLDLGPFLWFGDEPGRALPSLGDRVAKHSKANSEGVKKERPNLRELTKAKFEKLDGMKALTSELFGI